MTGILLSAQPLPRMAQCSWSKYASGGRENLYNNNCKYDAELFMNSQFKFSCAKLFDKWRTSIFRRMLFLKFGKGYRHLHAYWPYLKINFKEDGRNELFFKGKKIATTRSFAELKNKSFEELVIFGAGPSVRDVDLSKVKPQTAILVNGAMALANRLPGGPLLCIVFDYAFLWNERCWEMLRQLPPGTNLLTSDEFVGYALRQDRHLLDKFNLYVTCGLPYPYMAKERSLEQLPAQYARVSGRSAFSFDPAYGLFDGGTVLTWAIQMAYYLHPAVTYICGLDLGNFQQPHFYESEKTKIVSKGLLSDYQDIEDFMRLACAVFKEAGLAIYNCSAVTKLPYEIFPYSDHFVISK